MAKPAEEYSDFELSAPKIRPCCAQQPVAEFAAERRESMNRELEYQDGQLRAGILGAWVTFDGMPRWKSHAGAL
jgi:hypothetical protein